MLNIDIFFSNIFEMLQPKLKRYLDARQGQTKS